MGCFFCGDFFFAFLVWFLGGKGCVFKVSIVVFDSEFNDFTKLLSKMFIPNTSMKFEF